MWAPYADVCYFADAEWWQWQTKGVAKPKLGLSAADVRRRFAEFEGQKCTIFGSGMNVEDPRVHMLRKAGEHGLSLSADRLYTGNNSGFQAVNLAILTGAAIVPLLGYDAREPEPGADSHWFGHHIRREPTVVFRSYRKAFKEAAPAIKASGARVINCSPGSAIDVFERADIAAVL